MLLLIMLLASCFIQGCIKFFFRPPWGGGKKSESQGKEKGKEKWKKKGKMESKRGRVTTKERDGWGRMGKGREGSGQVGKGIGKEGSR